MFEDHDDPFLATDEAPPEADPKKKQSLSAISGKTKIITVHKEKAPLEGNKFRVLLELEGIGSEVDQPGVDIVVVLDVSGSMRDDNKVEKMKSATKFLINILDKNHRLSVVTFSTRANVRCPLRSMTVDAKDEVEDLVDNLETGGYTNIAAGLNLALNILDGRKYSRGRVPAIILLSDGDQDRRWDDATKVSVERVSVFTFGFGKGSGYNPEVLNIIANNSKGGTFSIVDVQNGESKNLHAAFALCLGWLLTVVVLDLQITITTLQSGVKINEVLPTNYPIDKDDYTATIKLGHLCNGEKRSYLIDLQLPGVANEGEYKVLEITYSHIYDGEPFDSKPKTVTVLRTKESLDGEKVKVDTETKRIETLDKMKKAIELANESKFDEAKSELQQAQDSLHRLNNSITEALQSQLEQLKELMDSDLYKIKGHHIALSMFTSHCRQREAITNDDLTKSNLFATNATVEFANNVKGLESTDDEPSSETEDQRTSPSPTQISMLVKYFGDLLKTAPKPSE